MNYERTIKRIGEQRMEFATRKPPRDSHTTAELAVGVFFALGVAALLILGVA